MNTSTQVKDVLCKKDGTLSVFGGITLRLMESLGKNKKWHYMHENGFKNQ